MFRPLNMGMLEVVDLKKSNDLDKLLNKPKNSHIILQFYTNVLGDYLARLGVDIDVLRVNVSKFPSIPLQYQVKELPTVIGVSKDRVMLTKRLEGSSNEEDITQFVDMLLSMSHREPSKIGDGPIDTDSISEVFPHPKNEKSTYKQYIFSNDIVANKSVSTIPGIGPIYAERMSKHDLLYARQLIGIFMQTGANIPQFQHWLMEKFGMSERWSRAAAESLAEVVRHLC